MNERRKITRGIADVLANSPDMEWTNEQCVTFINEAADAVMSELEFEDED